MTRSAGSTSNVCLKINRSPLNGLLRFLRRRDRASIRTRMWVHAGHIRLGLRFFAQDVSPEFAAFIIVHELAAAGDGVDIIDSGRGWFDKIFIKA